MGRSCLKLAPLSCLFFSGDTQQETTFWGPHPKKDAQVVLQKRGGHFHGGGCPWHSGATRADHLVGDALPATLAPVAGAAGGI